MENREYCECGEEMDKDCYGEPRCPACDPPCPACYDGGMDDEDDDEDEES